MSKYNIILKRVFSLHNNGIAPYLKETQIRAEIVDDEMKLEKSLKKLDESQSMSQVDLDASQKKVAMSQRKLEASRRKLDTYMSSRKIIQDGVDSSNHEAHAVDDEIKGPSKDEEFEEFTQILSTPQKPE